MLYSTVFSLSEASLWNNKIIYEFFPLFITSVVLVFFSESFKLAPLIIQSFSSNFILTVSNLKKIERIVQWTHTSFPQICHFFNILHLPHHTFLGNHSKVGYRHRETITVEYLSTHLWITCFTPKKLTLILDIIYYCL